LRDTFSHSPLPRYAQLADLLRQRIARGVWKEGDLLPSLDALVAEFGVARVTVRQAIERLARENLVSPQRGRGTFVTAQAGPDRWLRLETNLRDLADVYREDKPKLTLIEDTAAMPARPPEAMTGMVSAWASLTVASTLMPESMPSRPMSV
jgi:GntR family transcriptional regulator